MNEIYEKNKHLLIWALRGLDTAVEELTQRTYPCAPLPRYKLFKFTKQVSWPYIDDGKVLFPVIHIVDCYFGGHEKLHLNNPGELRIIVEQCLLNSEESPVAVQRTLRSIQAATAWCRARAEGRRRALEEILRQGKKAHEALEAEAALHSLSL